MITIEDLEEIKQLQHCHCRAIDTVLVNPEIHEVNDGARGSWAMQNYITWARSDADLITGGGYRAPSNGEDRECVHVR